MPRTPTRCGCTTTAAPGCSTSAARTGPATRSAAGAHLAEELGEDLRLLYVAMTRARCQVVAWWVPATTADTRRCTGCCSATSTRPRSRPPGSADARRGRARPPGRPVRVRPAEPSRSRTWATTGRRAGHRSLGSPPTLAAATFDRRLDEGWRRTSYTGLTRFLHDDSPRPGRRQRAGAGRSRSGRTSRDSCRGDCGLGRPARRGAAHRPVADGRLPVRRGVRNPRPRRAGGRRPGRGRPRRRLRDRCTEL